MASKPVKKKNTRKKTAKRQTNKPETQSFYSDEIIIWLTLAVSILILLSNFGFCGFAGETIATVLMGLFGTGAYLVPFLLFGTVTFLISNRENINAYIKAGAAIVLFVLLCILFELLCEAGGNLGYVFTEWLTPAIGIAGTYVVVIILIIICMVLITGKSLLKPVRTGSGRAYDRAKQDAARRKEFRDNRRELRRQEQERKMDERLEEQKRQLQDGRRNEKRKDKRVAGVSFATTLGNKEEKKSPELRELKTEAEELNKIGKASCRERV